MNPPSHPAFSWVADAPFFQAGLAGYSDGAMRLVARRHGCPYCVTEAMLDHFLINGGKGRRAAELDEADHPIAGQLMGSHAAEMAEAARILVDLGYDVIDLNLACPVKKIKKRCRGGHLLSAPEEAVEILEVVRRAVDDAVPLSIKLRRSYDDTPPMAEGFHRILQSAIDLGYAGATVHGRTVQQKYLGPASWPALAEITERYRSAMERGFLLFGSGDVDSPQAIFRMMEDAGVHGASVARGCIGNPWIFRQARQLMEGAAPAPPTLAEQRQVLLEHFELSVKLHGEKTAGRMMRKFGIKFSVHHPATEQVRQAFIEVATLADWKAVLDRHYREGGAVGAAGECAA